VPVAELLAETTEAFSCRSEGGAPIELRVNAPVDLLADGDPAQIRQIIWNILLNACEAMAEGGCVDVRARRVESLDPGIAQGLSEGSRREDESGPPGMDELCFATTVGITADVLPRIFNPSSTRARHEPAWPWFTGS
jgi:signal transduction histidine kinase